MSKHAGEPEQPSAADSGFEALQSTNEFRGPVEPLDGHEDVDHFALIYEDRADQFATVVPYITHGLERGEQCMYIVDDRSQDEIRTRLRQTGVDVDAVLETGQLSLHTVEETYMAGGEFDLDHARTLLQEAMTEAQAEFEGFRVTAEETWLVGNEHAQAGFMCCEAHVNQLLENEGGMALCQYNREALPATVIEDVINTHPYLIYDDTACPNDYYTPPQEYFGPDHTARENDRKLETLVDRTDARASLETRERYERQMYEITADSDRSFDEKLDGLFELGCERFELDVGGLAKVDPATDRFEVERTSADHEYLVPGAQVDLSETYCRVTTGQCADDPVTEPVAMSDPLEAGFDGDELAYQEFGVRAYLGSHLELDGADDRTFWFVSNSPREDRFTEAERTFHDMMGQWVQYELERRERERTLRERTEHLSAVVGNAPECIKTVAEDGTLLQMNPAGLEMVGADEASDVTGESVYDLIAPEDRERFREFNERICDGERDTLEFDLVALDGARRRMESHAAPLRRPDGSIVHVALTRDITEQVEREAELRQTKNRFETVFENSNDAMVLFDPAADRFIDANSSALELLGYDRETLLESGPSALHPHEPDQLVAFLEELTETGSGWTEELSWKAADGEEIPVEISASSFELEDRSVMLAVVRDISEQKTHERYQRELYEITAVPDLSFDGKLERLLELGRERFDLEMGGLNHLPSWDGEFCLEKGVGLGVDDSEELWTDPGEGCYCRRTVSENDPVAMVDARGTHWAEDEIYQNFGMTSYLGAEVSSGGAPYGTLWFGSSEPRGRPFSTAERSFIELMAQWVSYEVERREQHESQRELYEITADPDLDTDEKIQQLLATGCDRLNLPIGVLTNSTREAFEVEQMKGSHPDISVGMLTPGEGGSYCSEVVERGDSVSVADAEAVGWDEGTAYQEFGFECYAGTPVMVHGETYGTVFFANTAPRDEFTEAEQAFLDLLGKCVGYEIERKQHEADLEETISQLEQSNDRLKQFAYAASHDLQEPLRMVSSYLQLLENRHAGALDEDAQEYIEFAVDGADRMRAMVDDLLTFARVEQEESEFTRVDCDAVLDNVTDDLQIQIEENDADVRVESLPTLVGDKEQLEQLFSNLVSNGVKYNESDSPRVEVTADRRDDAWEFALRDNGIGIDPEQSDRIFEVFKRLHNADEYSGTGIGLSLCQEIVENHGGEIRVESDRGEGSTFYVTIPAAETTNS